MDIEAGTELIDYLRAAGHLKADETPAVHILSGGVSNRTVLVQRTDGPDMVIKQSLAKLRVKADWYSDPSRIYREAEGMRLLAQLVPDGATPALLFEDRANHLLAMEAIPAPHTNWKQDLLSGHIDTRVVEQFGVCLAAIHAFNPEGYPPGGMLQGLAFFESLRLEPYYLYTASHVPAAADFLHALVAETRSQKLALVHGDYSPKNVLVHNGRMVLLDHEVIHLGDPAFDVGFSMTHLLSKAHHMPAYRNTLLQAATQYWAAYRKGASGYSWFAESEIRAVRHTLACMLARVAGKSPLEYLDASTQQKQQQMVCTLMQAPPASMPALLETIAELLT